MGRGCAEMGVGSVARVPSHLRADSNFNYHRTNMVAVRPSDWWHYFNYCNPPFHVRLKFGWTGVRTPHKDSPELISCIWGATDTTIPKDDSQ